MMLGVSQGTVKCATATCGLPRGLSQLSSKAVQRSAPKKGNAPVGDAHGVALGGTRRWETAGSGSYWSA